MLQRDERTRWKRQIKITGVRADLESKKKRLAELTDELKKAAAEAKKNAPDKEKTCYFSMARLKKEAAKLRQAENKLSGKKKTVGKKKSQEVG